MMIYNDRPISPDRSFWHLAILHSPCWGCERECCRGRRKRRGGRGRGRHRDNSGWGWRCWEEGRDGDFLGLRGIFATMGAEKHSTLVWSAATAAQNCHAAPVETVSYALVWAALKKCALQDEEQEISMWINRRRFCIGCMHSLWMTVGGGMLSHRQAEEPTAWTAVMLDHMRAMNFAKHHERHPAGGPHGLSFNRPIGTRPQLTQKLE